jgi:hypothetical protein|tara:strand:+ start:593 stop:1030 length:438 start_codon:yes stop_codon:yes gene_type:complete
MKYLPQSKLAEWRKENAPKKCPLVEYKTSNWVVDHNHTSGFVRGVVSSEGNALLGRIENAFKRLSRGAKKASLPTILRNMASYLEQDDLTLLHPEGFRQLYKRFYSLSKDLQLDILLKFGTNRDDISKCKNAKERTELYKQIIKQ